jgi:hypothetical protein
MRIIRARLKPISGTSEFLSVKGRIKNLISNNHGEDFHFVIDENGSKSVQSFGPGNINDELVGKTLPIISDSDFVLFKEDGTIELVDIKKNEESLPRQQTVDQLKKLRKMTKGVDIGDRISDLNTQGANIQYYRNTVDSGIESYEDFEKKNKKFVPSWNLKHLISPFKK